MRRRPRELRAVEAEISHWWRLLKRYRRGAPTVAELAAEEAMNAALDRVPRAW